MDSYIVIGGASNAGRAYATFLAGDGDYVKGAVRLAKGLRKVKAARPIVVAVLPDVPDEHRRMLLNHGCIIRDIEPLYPPEGKNHDFARADFVVNYSKLRIWKLVEYEKTIYLDADIQVYGNIDHLFDLPYGCLYAATDSFCETPCRRCPDKVSWPEELGPKPSLYFNAGMFLFERSLRTHDDLLEALKVTPGTSFAEQDFLNVFFRENCHPIPPLYNFLVVMWWRHPEKIELENVKVIHYCAADLKPWKFTSEEIENVDSEEKKMLMMRWWNIYKDDSLDYKNYINVSAGGKVESNRYMEALSEVGVLHHISGPTAGSFCLCLWGILLRSNPNLIGALITTAF